MDDPSEQQLVDAVRAANIEVQATQPESRPRRWDAHKVDQTEVAFNVFMGLLATDGVRAALYSLLRRTDYRFIAIFRFERGLATSAVYVDRENLLDQQAGEVPDTATYCCYVRDVNGVFITADAMHDRRTTGHVAREVVRAYCGLPLMTSDGQFIGTLCHYDLVPRDPEQLDPALLLRAARALVASGQIPPYPGSSS